MNRDPRKLFIYECRGDGSPSVEPECEGFLGTWPEPPFYYLFFDREAAACVNQWLMGQHGWSLGDCYKLDYDQWQQISCLEQKIGPFLIHTGNGTRKIPGSDEGIPVRLDPGVVFGSGVHETTKGCLLAIATLFETLPIKTVVDLGTGTGILALASALLGASRVLALDCNPLAVSVTKRNVRANSLEGAVSLLVARELSVLKEPSDLLAMNLEWPCLLQVMKGSDWLGYGCVVLSGFLGSQWDHLKGLIPHSHHVLSKTVLDDWMTVVVAKSP